jgi:hypothetical protein
MIATPQRQELGKDFSNNVRIFMEKFRDHRNSGKIEFCVKESAGGVEGWSFMGANRLDEGTGDPAVSEVPVASKFKSVRRVFRIMDLVSLRGEELTAKELAREVGTNLSSCYYLLKILADEGYIQKIAGGGYRIGPTIPSAQRRFEERLRHQDRTGRQGACAARPEARLRGGAH